MENSRGKNQRPLFEIDNNYIEILDISTIELYKRCPLEYKHRFLPRNNQFDPQGGEVLLGRLLHAITADFLSFSVNDRSTKANIDEYANKLKKYEFLGGNYYKIGIKAIENIISGPLSKLPVQAIERSFKKYVDSFLLKGRIDCIARGERGDLIIDFKIDPQELEHHLDQCDRFLQLIFYCFGISGTLPVTTPFLAYYYYTNATIEMIKVTESLISEGMDRIYYINSCRKNEKAYLPKKSYYCASCMIRIKGLCSLWL